MKVEVDFVSIHPLPALLHCFATHTTISCVLGSGAAGEVVCVWHLMQRNDGDNDTKRWDRRRRNCFTPIDIEYTFSGQWQWQNRAHFKNVQLNFLLSKRSCLISIYTELHSLWALYIRVNHLPPSLLGIVHHLFPFYVRNSITFLFFGSCICMVVHVVGFIAYLFAFIALTQTLK